jgi:CBS domain-containing protein
MSRNDLFATSATIRDDRLARLASSSVSSSASPRHAIRPTGGAGAELVRVADVMSAGTAAVPPWLPMAAARRIAALKGVEHLLVEHEGRLLGIVCGAELAAPAAPGDRVSLSMKPPPPSGYVDPTMTAASAVERLAEDGAHFLIVSRGPFVMGIVTREALERRLSQARRRVAAERAA